MFGQVLAQASLDAMPSGVNLLPALSAMADIAAMYNDTDLATKLVALIRGVEAERLARPAN